MAGRIEKSLAEWFSGAGNIVLVGIGNPIRTDDYIGLRIAEDLKGKLPKRILLLEAEGVPENYLQDIEEFAPSHVLLIDLAFLGLNPGEANLINADQIMGYSAVSTHLLPLRLFCDYVKEATGAKIALLLIEPKNMEFGEGLTTEVKAAAERMESVLLTLLN